MFCPKCGAQVPEGFGFCSECGSRVEVAQPQVQPQPQYQYQPQPQPQYAPQYQPPYQTAYQPQPQYQSAPAREPVTPDKKGAWLRKKAPANAKRNSLITLIICLLGVLALGGAIVNAITVPFFDVPAISLVVEIAGEDPYELVEELEGELEYTKIQYEFEKDLYSKSEQKAAENMLDAMEKAVDRMSVVNFLNLVNVMMEEGKELDEYSASDLEDMETIQNALLIVVVLVAAVLALPLLFILLGGLRKSMAMTIVGIVLMIAPQLCLGGVLLTLLSLVLGILQAVFCGKVNKEYDRYRNNCLNGI